MTMTANRSDSTRYRRSTQPPHDHTTNIHHSQSPIGHAWHVLHLIDDDEWFELGMALSGTIQRLPPGSRIVESLQMPPFRLAISASASEMPEVVTRPWKSGLDTTSDALKVAVNIADNEARSGPPGAVTIAVTQTSNGEHYAICVVGLPGEQRSWTSLDLPRGGHAIDAGEMILDELEGWAVRPRSAESGGHGGHGGFAAA